MSEISVVMCTYNGARYVTEQLQSLADQDLAPAELVVVDDCSTDDTVEKVRDFAAKAPFPVRVFVNAAQLGYRRNFMHAATHARHPLVAFCDQDDVWYPNKLSRCLREFDDPDCLLCFHDADSGSQPGRVDALSLLDRSPMEYNSSGHFTQWTYCNGLAQVFRRSLLQFNGLQGGSVDHNAVREIMAHDQWVFFLANSFGKVVLVPDKLLFYRQHASNSFGAGAGQSRFSILRDKLFGPTDDLVVFRKGSESRERIMREIALAGGHPWVDKAAWLAAYYRRLADFYAKRLRIHESAGRPQALANIVRSVWSGGYKRVGPEHRTALALVRDVVGIVYRPGRSAGAR